MRAEQQRLLAAGEGEHAAVVLQQHERLQGRLQVELLRVRGVNHVHADLGVPV